MDKKTIGYVICESGLVNEPKVNLISEIEL